MPACERLYGDLHCTALNDRKKHCVAARQKLGHIVTALPLLETGKGLRAASRIRDLLERLISLRRESDHPPATPTGREAAYSRIGGNSAKSDWRSPVQGHLL